MKLLNQRTWNLPMSASCLVITTAMLLHAQQNEFLVPKTKVDNLVRLNCRNDDYCAEGDTYVATLTDILESTTPHSRLVRLILTFENLGEDPIVLAYRAHSIYVLDNFKSRYFCCTNQTSADSSAVGIGIDQGSNIDPHFMLKPHQSANTTFDVWTYRTNPRASYYDVNIMIDEIDPTDLNAIRRNPILAFRGVMPKVRRNLRIPSAKHPND